jgi:hypothetical protein
MKLHDMAAETAFTAPFDARFPYDDIAKSARLIEEARAISLNAIFFVLHELCRAPHSNAVTLDRQRELIALWACGFEHPLKEPLLRCASALVDHITLPWAEAVMVMEQVGQFDGQRAALSIAYFSGDCDGHEGNAALNDAEEHIRQAWMQKGA